MSKYMSFGIQEVEGKFPIFAIALLGFEIRFVWDKKALIIAGRFPNYWSSANKG